MTTFELGPLFSPRSVAIVGASASAGSFGDRVLTNLRQGGFDGDIYPVNPRYDSVGDLDCFPDLSAIPGPVDCAVLVVPAAAAVDGFEQAIANKISTAVVLAAGFKETGDEDGRRREEELARRAAEAEVTLLGPNCLGMVNFGARTALTFGPGMGALTSDMGGSGGLAVVSQSGGLGSFLLHASTRGVPFSYFVSTGNSTALDVGDCVGYLAPDPQVTGFCLAYEGLRPGTRLLEALEVAQAHGKPVVALKTGRSRSGQAAAVSHTGSAVGDGRASVAALKARSVFVVDALDELIEPAAFLAKARQRPPSSDGVAVATGSGGAAVMVCDSAERHSMRLAHFSDTTVEAVSKLLPANSKVANPVDVTASSGVSGGDTLTAVLEEVVTDDDVGALLVPLGVGFKEEGPSGNRPAALAALAARVAIPTAVVWLSQTLESPGTRLLESSPDAGLFRSMELAVRTLAHLTNFRTAPLASSVGPAATRAAESVAALCGDGRSGLLSEIDSTELLETAGVPMVARARCRDKVELAAALENWSGYPAVLKVVSADLPHKSKVGGVQTMLADPTAVLAAADDIIAAVGRKASSARIEGFLLQQMVMGSAEILLGGFRDPVYGPVVAVGAGGIAAGARSAVSVAAAPLTPSGAANLVATTSATSALPDHTARALADAVTAVGDLLVAAPAIEEIDINPVIVSHDGRSVGVDGLITIRAADSGRA